MEIERKHRKSPDPAVRAAEKLMIARIRKNPQDTEAWNFLFSEEKQQQIYATCLRIVKNESLAEELKQETFLSVLLNIGQFKGASGIMTWITRIAINKSLMLLRSADYRRTVSLDEMMEMDIKKTPPPQILESDRELEAVPQRLAEAVAYKELKRAGNHLANKDRAIVALRLKDNKFKDIARILGENEPTIKTRFHRALGKMRVKLVQHQETNACPRYQKPAVLDAIS